MQVKQAGGAIGAMLDAYRLSGWQIEFRREGTHDTDGWFVIERPWVDWPKNIPPIKRAQQALAQAASAWFHDPKTAARLTGMDEIERGLWYAARDIAESQP